MTWYEFPKMTITLSVEAESEEEAITKLDGGRWETNQPGGFQVEIDIDAPPYEGPNETDD